MLISKRIASGFASGVLIGIGGTVYLRCENKYVGAILFSVALLCICFQGYSLFTGKVGYLAHSRTKSELSVLFCGLLGNFLGAVALAALVYLCFGAQLGGAAELAQAKLAQTMPQTFARALLCGVLMYMAVSIFKRNKTPLGILFCIPVFILCGFEHSIADMFYLAAGLTASADFIGKALLFLVTAILGNAVGAVCIALFDRAKETAQ